MSNVKGHESPPSRAQADFFCLLFTRKSYTRAVTDNHFHAILFDIDGVLLDSVRSNAKFYRDVLEHFKYRGPTDEEQRSLNHLPLMDELRHFAPTADAARLEAIHAYADSYEGAYDLLDMSDYARQLVERLAQRFSL